MNSGAYAVVGSLVLWAFLGLPEAVVGLVGFFVGYFLCAYNIGKQNIREKNAPVSGVQ